MKITLIILALILTTSGIALFAMRSRWQKPENLINTEKMSFYDLTYTTIDGKSASMADFKGKFVLWSKTDTRLSMHSYRLGEQRFDARVSEIRGSSKSHEILSQNRHRKNLWLCRRAHSHMGGGVCAATSGREALWIKRERICLFLIGDEIKPTPYFSYNL